MPRPLQRPPATSRPDPILPAAVLALLLVVLATGSLLGCGRDSQSSARRDPSGTTNGPAPTALEEPPYSAALSNLTVAQQAAQVLLVGFPPGAEDDPNSALATLMRLGPPGGVLLFGGNVGAPSEVKALTTRLQADARASGTGVPLLVAVDQEGGEIRRLREGVPDLPSARDLATGGTSQAAGSAAQRTGEALRELGVNTNLAPVADVVSDPESFLYDRSYGGDPDIVSAYVAQVVGGYEAAGILSCAKHFPGHGATSGDTHEGIATAPVPSDTWEEVHLPPFRSAIAAGVPLVMAAHVVAPAFDPEKPASRSAAVLTDLLRGRLGFEGVVVTDDLAMAGAGDPADAAVASLEAGADLLILSSVGEAQLRVHRAIVDAVEAGRLPASRLEEAAGRVLAAKAAYGILGK